MDNPKIDPALIQELKADGKSAALSMDEIVSQAGFDYITRYLRRDCSKNAWYFEGSDIRFNSPESAATHYWLKKPL